jgi:hypothetical protein
MISNFVVDKNSVTPWTKIQVTASTTGGTEQETQAVIDGLQEKGWNVTWGTGPTTFCSEAEKLAFMEDFNAVVGSIVMIGGMA